MLAIDLARTTMLPFRILVGNLEVFHEATSLREANAAAKDIVRDYERDRGVSVATWNVVPV